MDAIESEFTRAKRNSEVMASFGYRLFSQFNVNKAYRRLKEIQWLEDLRMYKGVYDDSVQIEEGNSRVYPKIPRSKLAIVLSRLHSMLFPDRERNWEFKITPEPSISKETVTKIALSLVKEDPNQPGVKILPTEPELKLAIQKYAKATSEKMSNVIDDQLTEMDEGNGYSELVKKQVLRPGLQYGTGLLKGPLVGKRATRKWTPTVGGEYQEQTESEDVPELQGVRMWDWYPDMTGTELSTMTGSFERHVMTKHDLRMLMKRDDFYKDVIEQHLRDHKDGDYTPENWEVDLQVIELQAGGERQEKGFSTVSTGPTNATNIGTSSQLGKKYIVLEYWGYVDGADMEACGVDVDDPELEYAANVWLLGNKVIKAALYPAALDMYKVFYYEKDETSIFGEGLVRVMRGSALAVGAGARMVLDNGACVSGPNIECNWSLLTPGTDINSFYPRKIWFREGKGVDAQYPALRALNFDSHISELITIIELFKSFGDEETTLPTWMIGQQVNNETAQATSGRNATVLVSIKDIVKNFDTFTEHVMRDICAWNMEFNPREDIKGDFKCKARGVSSLVMKEIRMQALAQLSTTLTPEERDWIPEKAFIDQRLKAFDLDIELRTQEEVDSIRQSRSESVTNQLALEFQKSEIAKNKAQAMSLLTKAKKVNTEATKEAQTPIEQPAGESPELSAEQVALAQTERQGKEAEIARKNDAHMMDMESKGLEMEHKDEAHRMQMAATVAEKTHGMVLKEKMAEHKQKMGEKATEAAVKVKKAAAKTVKTAPKPTTRAKKAAK